MLSSSIADPEEFVSGKTKFFVSLAAIDGDLVQCFMLFDTFIKLMDLSSWLGANRSDAQWHREDLQQRQGGKDAVLCVKQHEALH